jgi:CRISPR/Cas system-associated exonuclease Cas4 (RecB family)
MLVSQKEVNITIDNYTDYIEDPPAYSEQKAKGHKGSGKIYFHMKEYENKKLGDAGEQFVLNLEKKRLEQLGKEEIKVDWIAKENDFAGYDILSCSKDGQERLIEVKTTNKSKDHPFYLSALEYQTLKDNLDKYFIYRVFDFKENPRCFIISAEQLLELTINPVNYRISFEKPVDNQ